MDEKIRFAKCLSGDKLTLNFVDDAVVVIVPVEILLSSKVSSLFELDCLSEYSHDSL